MMHPVPKPNFKRRIPKRYKRGEFSTKTRQKIYERDIGTCRECGYPGSELHHVKFRGRGGRGVFTNGLLVCTPCHQKIHQHKILANKWVYLFEKEYGHDFHKDEFDV